MTRSPESSWSLPHGVDTTRRENAADCTPKHWFQPSLQGSSRLAVDGELVAFGDDGLLSFPRLCERMLHGKRRVEVILIVFDVLAIDGRAVYRRPRWERRQRLEGLALNGDYWSTTPSHTDGEALWEKVCELGLEASSPRNAAAT